VQIGDLVKCDGGSIGYSIIIVLGFIHSTIQGRIIWVKGLEIGSITHRLYDPECCEIISANR